MTQKELKQYRSMKAEIAEINEQIGQCMTIDIVTGSDHEFPYTQHAVKITGVTRDVACLISRRSRLMQRKEQIERFVEGIEDSELRRIFQYRYLWGRYKPSWQRVAFQIGYTDESSPRKKHENFLNQSEKSENRGV